MQNPFLFSVYSNSSQNEIKSMKRQSSDAEGRIGLTQNQSLYPEGMFPIHMA